MRWLAVACLLCACASEEIVVSRVDVPDATPEDEERPRAARDRSPCRTNADCEIGTFCARRDCGDASGVCERRPAVCGAQAAPVCGCDGITYFNDCLRRTSGVSAAIPGECDATAVGCGGPGNATCPQGASCARLLPPGEPCRPAAPGTCWRLPTQCEPDTNRADRWDACGPGPRCVDTCAAIRSNAPHVRALACP